MIPILFGRGGRDMRCMLLPLLKISDASPCHWHLLPENPGGQTQELFSSQEPPLRHIEQSSKDKTQTIAKNSKEFDDDTNINGNLQWPLHRVAVRPLKFGNVGF